MSTRFRTFLAVLLMACGAAAYADPPSRVARLNYVAGPVSFAPADAPDGWMQAVLNRPLTTADRLWTDDTGRAELHVGSTAIRLAAFTSLDFLNIDEQALQMRLAQGTVNVRVRDLAQGDVVEIATPAGAVLLRQPGSYRISADPQSDTTRVLASFGQAELITPTQTFTVPSGQSAVLAQGALSFEVAAYASADDFDRWSADRDRREDRSNSARYVSREMTGYEDLDQHGTWRTLPEYGAVWVPARVASGWAPYRNGHWAWVSPWGWTWIDDAPWGFAPFHYGRWVWTGGYWAWAPGAVVRRPVYAPALVAFVGGSRWSVSSGPAVGWFPLGYREPYRPWYRASETHVRNVNVTNVTNVTNVYNTTNVTYINRANPRAVTVVPQQAFVSARPVAQATVQVAPAELARADAAQAAPPAQPVRASFGHDRAGHRPPPQALAREVVAVNPPAQSASQQTFAPQGTATSAARRAENEPRVRVISRDRDDARAERFRAQPTQGAPAAIAPQPSAAGPAAAPAAVGTPATSAPATVTRSVPASAPQPTAAVPAPTPAGVAPPTTTAPATVTRSAPASAPQPVAATPAPAPSAVVSPATPPATVTRSAPASAPGAAPPSTSSTAAAAIAPPAATAAPTAPTAATAPQSAPSQRRYGSDERRSSPRESAAPATATFSSAPAQVDPRAVQREQHRQERAAARPEDRAARATAAPDARPAAPPEQRPARAEERRPREAQEAPRARPPGPQPGQGAAPAASPQREVRLAEPARAPAPAASPAARGPEPQRPAPEQRRAQPAS